MNENEQINEMAAIIDDNHGLIVSSVKAAEALYKANYRKVERGEWISVEDRLPDNNGRVLVYLGNNHHVKTDTDRYFGYWARWGENVTHWMPLPEPPSGADMRGEGK